MKAATVADFEWRPSLRQSFATAPLVGLAPAGFVLLYGVRTGHPALSVTALLAYSLGAMVICVLIARTHVTVEVGRITVHRLRSRSCAVSDIARLVVVPITYPGLRTAAGVVTTIALDRSGKALLRVATRAWTPAELEQFINACHAPRIIRATETLTPRQAIERWPGSYSPRSEWRGYVILVVTLASIAAVGGLISWAVLSAPSTH